MAGASAARTRRATGTASAAACTAALMMLAAAVGGASWIPAAWATATDDASLHAQIAARDALLFEVGYNDCDLDRLDDLIAETFEFYHDQGGTLMGRTAFLDETRDGLCALDYEPRRELVADSLRVYPLYDDGKLYGAVQSGEHRFYATYGDAPEVLTSTARFTHIWILEDGAWRLSRVISYDHQAPPGD